MNPISFTFSSKDHLSLFGRAWISTKTYPKGIVQLIHGLGEHSGRYDHVGNALAKAGYHLTGFDLRGHGLSAGRRGHAPDFANLLDDLEIFIDESTKHLGNSLPRFLYGHGLGGNLVINYMMQNPSDLDGAIVTSPAFERTHPPSKLKVVVLRIMATIVPGFPIKNGLETNALSRNLAIVKAYQDDVYVHNALSARLGFDILNSGWEALQNAEKWETPLLLMHGTGDRITSHKSSQQFAAIAGDQVELVLWESFYHELHHDFGSEKAIEHIINWLDKNANG
jgi:alpha-beta hydrolase superfamily lysophospholipase